MSNELTTNTTSLFEYVPQGASSHVISDIPEVIDRVKGNLLDFNTKFESGDITQGQLAKIARELESAAVYFGEQQGLSGSNLISIGPSGLHADIHGKSINFKNSAVDKYNRFYAGHIEYGHYTRNGKSFVPARPFMRPALYAVSKASMGEIENVLSDMLMTIFRGNGNGYNGISNLQFGTKLGSLYHYSHFSNDVASSLSSQKIGEYSTGKDLNLQGNFERRMSAWSLKRNSQSQLQKRMKNSVGFNHDGRNSNMIKQNLNTYYHSKGSSSVNQARTFGFKRSTVDLKKEQEKMAQSFKEKKNAKKQAMKTGKYKEDLNENKGSKTHQVKTGFYSSEEERDAARAQSHRDAHKGLGKVDPQTRIYGDEIRAKVRFQKLKEGALSARYMKRNHVKTLERKNYKPVKHKTVKDPKIVQKNKVNSAKNSEKEVTVIKVYPVNPALVPENKRANFLKTQYTEYSMTKEQLENSRYQHYTKDMYY